MIALRALEAAGMARQTLYFSRRQGNAKRDACLMRVNGLI
jgi:hypothetical protein